MRALRCIRARTLGVVGESGSGKTTVGMLLMRLIDATAGQVLYQGKRSADDVRRRDDGVPTQDPDHLPESVRQPESALHCRADPDRADEDPRHRHRRRRPLRTGGRTGAARRPRRRQRVQVPARIFRRTAAAHRHCAMFVHEARRDHLRRIGVGARRIGAGHRAQPAAGPAGRVRHDVHLHQP